jgi:para-aminobenzoate synthetase component 2
LTVTRYHSLVVDPTTVPEDLLVTSRTDDEVIMGLRHRSLPIEGVQFHPESILSDDGLRMISNFLDQ